MTGVQTCALPIYGHVSILSADELAGHDQVISSSNDGMLRLWALGQLSAKQFSTGDEITFAMPSVDQKYVFTGPDEGKFAKWSLADGSRVESMHLGDCDAAQTMAMTSEAEPLVATSALSTICLFQWGKPDSMRKLLGHAHPIRRVAFSPDGNFLASTSADEELLIFDVHSANVKVRLKHDPSPRGVSFSHDGKLLAVGTQDGSIHVWAWQEAREVRVWKAHGDSVFSVEFTKDDLHLVTVSKDQQVALWVASSGKLISRFAGHQQVVSWGEAAPHSALIASIDWFGTVYVWDAQRGWALDQIRAGGATNYVRWLDNEALIVGLGSRQAVTLYEPARSTNNHQCRNPLAWSTSGITPREAWPSECGSTE